MEQALTLAVSRPITFVADVIIKDDTWRRLPAAIAWLADRGVREVHLWYVSLSDGNKDNVASLPRMGEVMPTLHEALRLGVARGLTVRSLHVPRCLLGELHGHAWDPGGDRVRVVSPDATFDLKDSRLAGRVHVAACEPCPFRAQCPGVPPTTSRGLARVSSTRHEREGARGAALEPRARALGPCGRRAAGARRDANGARRRRRASPSRTRCSAPRPAGCMRP